jgi:hypothetical protein
MVHADGLARPVELAMRWVKGYRIIAGSLREVEESSPPMSKEELIHLLTHAQECAYLRDTMRPMCTCGTHASQSEAIRGS